MLKPSAEQMALLNGWERFSYRVAHIANHRFKWLFKWWNFFFTVGFVHVSTSRRIRITGLENLTNLDPASQVLLVANHRSFFDFFIIGWITYWKTKLSIRTFFPVRSTFFYEGAMGNLVNLVVGGLAMFPPVIRSKEKRAFNRFSIDKMVELLDQPKTILGMHPEGTRSQDGDPYTFPSVRPGVGELAIRCKEAKVMPIFILGLSNKIATEIKQNLVAVEGNEIDVVIGPPVELDDLRAKEESKALYVEAAERCMDAVRGLGDRQKEIAAERLASRR